MIYSHSRLATFKQCPKKFEFQYVLKPKVEKIENMSAFMGQRVHETLEQLFKDLQHTKQTSLSESLTFYEKKWKENYTDKVVIHKEGLTAQHYFELGKKCITNFYETNIPFKRGKVIGIEKEIKVDLNDDKKYRLTGYIDLLVQTGKDHFQVHDYKTYAELPSNDKMNEDEQLALYQLWLEKEFPEAKKIDLIWHYVVFGREGLTHRNAKQLAELKKNLIQTIDRVESTKVFETKTSALCSFCNYKPICPAWKHAEEVAKLPAKKYEKDEGVKLANEYASAYYEKRKLVEEIDSKLETLQEEIFAYAQQHGFEVIQGKDYQLKVKSEEKVRFPGKNTKEREPLEELIRQHNLWLELSELDTTRLKNYLEEGKIDPKIAKRIEKMAEKYESKSISVSKKKA